jgi:hypothetical protein
MLHSRELGLRACASRTNWNKAGTSTSAHPQRWPRPVGKQRRPHEPPAGRPQAVPHVGREKGTRRHLCVSRGREEETGSWAARPLYDLGTSVGVARLGTGGTGRSTQPLRTSDPTGSNVSDPFVVDRPTTEGGMPCPGPRTSRSPTSAARPRRRWPPSTAGCTWSTWATAPATCGRAPGLDPGSRSPDLEDRGRIVIMADA